MPKTFTLDGETVSYEPGQTIMEVAHARGEGLPHYCWHPGLSVSGNCRICMVDIEGWRTPAIGCNTPISEGMVVRTNSEMARKAQSDVMELMLINHPLDCPICDQAGECKLQETSYELGSGGSRFDLPKQHKPKNVRFSDKVTFDAERCILCTRCVRFCDEIAGEAELDIVHRGDHNTIAVARGEELKSPYQMNTIDVCPVGALTSTDFRFKSRVWFLKQTRSVCGSCSRGCNVTVGSRWNRVLRLVPSENPDVNQWWMCDDGRLNFRYVEADDRLGAPMVRGTDGQLAEVSWKEALDAAAEGLRTAGTDVFALVSARLTNEELWLARKLLDGLGATHCDTKPREWPQDDLLRTGDGNPNTRGAAELGIATGAGLDALAAGKFKAAFLCGEDLDDRPELLAALEKLDFVVVVDFRESDTSLRAAHVVLPGMTHFEKEGSFTNVDGRVQRVLPAVKAPGSARPDWQILGDLRTRIDRTEAPRTAAATFRALAEDVPAFEGLLLGKLGDYGQPLNAPAAVGTPGEEG